MIILYIRWCNAGLCYTDPSVPPVKWLQLCKHFTGWTEGAEYGVLLLPIHLFLVWHRNRSLCLLSYCGPCLLPYRFLPVPGAPTGVTSEIVSVNSMELRWNPPNNPNGIILQYQVTFRGYATGNETVSPPYIISMH